MKSSIRLWLTISLMMGLVFSLSSCSSRLVYNQLDWLIPLYANQYVTLDRLQKRQFKQEVQSLLDWHRAEQLPEYKRFIDTLITQVIADPQPTVIEQQFSKIMAFTQSVQLKAAHPFLPLILGLSDQQKTEMIDTLRDKNEQFAKDYVYIGEAQARVQNADKMQSQLIKWLGYVTPQQQAHIERFANEYQWIAPSSLDVRQRRLAYFERHLFQETLDDNAHLSVIQQLTDYQAFWDDGLIQAFEINKQRFSEMLAAVLHDSEPRQINRLIKRLEGYKKL